MGKLVSVIIPCYNSTKWLPQCFVSLAEQTIGIDNIELIFVNDASTDNGATWEMLTDIEKAYPESVIIIDLPVNRRQGGARNEGLKYASGEYIAFVDSDDWVDKDMLRKVYGRAKETDADIVQFNHYICVQGIKMIKCVPSSDNLEITINSIKERKDMLVSEKLTYGCWNKLYRKSLVDSMQVQFAENVIYEEPLFVYPLLFAGKKYVTMPDYLYMYRQNVNGTMYNDMKAYETLKQHSEVQLKVWQFMKNTSYFEKFYEEIKLYFLHTCFYETLDFAKARGMKITYDLYQYLYNIVVSEVQDYDKSVYELRIPKQMRLYRLARQGMTEKMLEEYCARL